MVRDDDKFVRRVKYLEQDLRRRARALNAILVDLSDSEAIFDDVVVVVDWSEVYSYICGIGLPQSDFLFHLFDDDDRVNGAHQAALSFLFRVFPKPLLILPPHVRELIWFAEAAQRFADLRTIDETLMRVLYKKLLDQSEPFRSLLKAYEDWRAQHTIKKSPSDDELIEIFEKLEKGDENEIHRLLTKLFAPMFLLGRWMSIEAYNDLEDLLVSRQGTGSRLMFLKDYDEGLCSYLSKQTRDIEDWKSELPSSPQKGEELVKNDARALAYLQVMNVCLHEREKQVLFVTRSEDIADTVKARPEWFSCIADRYFTATIDKPNMLDPLPTSILRDWIYFFELGSVWKWKPDGKQIKLDIESRLERVQAMISSLPKGNEIPEIERNTLENYFEEEGGLLNNIQALWSAQGAKFDRNRGPGKNTQIRKEPLLDFLRYVTNPEEFLDEHRNLKDKLAEVLDRINSMLPPVPSSKTFRYRPLLRNLLKLIDPSELVRDIEDGEKKWMVEALLKMIKNGEERIEPSSPIGKAIQSLSEHEEAEDAVYWLIHALHAYVYHSYSKARALIIAQPTRRFRGLTKVIRLLIIADCWLVEHERLRQVDDTLKEILRDASAKSHPTVSLAISDVRLQLEIEASYEHGEDPHSFRRDSSSSNSRLRECWDDTLKRITAIYPKPSLENPLYRFAVESIVHAGARLTFVEDDVVGEIFADPIHDSEVAQPTDIAGTYPVTSIVADGEADKPIDIVSKHLADFEEWCKNTETISHHDAIAYYYFKKACLSHGKERKNFAKRAQEYLTDAAEELSKQERNSTEKNYEKRLVRTHSSLIERMVHGPRVY